MIRNICRFITTMLLICFSAAGWPQWTVGSRGFGGGPWTYYTSSGINNTSCTATYQGTNPCASTDNYTWASQPVSGTVTIHVKVSGSIQVVNASGIGNAYIYYNTTGGCGVGSYMYQYTYSTVGTLTWSYDEYSTTVSVSNLNSLLRPDVCIRRCGIRNRG